MENLPKILVKPFLKKNHFPHFAQFLQIVPCETFKRPFFSKNRSKKKLRIDKSPHFVYNNLRVILKLEDNMAEYRTEQKKMLSDFLKANRDQAYTVEDLVEKMRELYGENVPALSTVYRLITRLVEEGTVKRFVKGHSRRFVYQIVEGEHCRSHLHMKCIGCGRLLHLDDRVSDELLYAVRSSSQFSVNEEETVLFGQCAACDRKPGVEEQEQGEKRK